MSEEQLEQAIGFVQAGKIEEARNLLEQILKEDRSNISAWHWYAQTWSSSSEKIRIWEACLRYNPTNVQAQEALRNLQPAKKINETVTGTAKPAARSSSFVMWGGLAIVVVAAVLGVLLILNSMPKDAAKYIHHQPVEYYLYVPKSYKPDHDWPLFVGIHGAGENGLACWNLWQAYAEKEGFILLCPTIPGDASGFRQDVGEQTVWSAIGSVQKDYRIRSRMFFAGFSAGAFFIQGFDYHYPNAVNALAILSAGLYLNPRLFPQIIPMTIVIGGSDDPTAVQTSQMFADGLNQYGFHAQYTLLPGVGHTVTNKGKQLTIELFRTVNQK